MLCGGCALHLIRLDMWMLLKPFSILRNATWIQATATFWNGMLCAAVLGQMLWRFSWLEMFKMSYGSCLHIQRRLPCRWKGKITLTDGGWARTNPCLQLELLVIPYCSNIERGDCLAFASKKLVKRSARDWSMWTHNPWLSCGDRKIFQELPDNCIGSQREATKHGSRLCMQAMLKLCNNIEKITVWNWRLKHGGFEQPLSARNWYLILICRAQRTIG